MLEQLLDEFLSIQRCHQDDQSGYYTGVRKALALEYSQGAEFVGENGIRKRLAEIDLEFFGRAYFPDYFSSKASVFHSELDSLWTKHVIKPSAATADGCIGSRLCVAAPRGHAKSTILTFKNTLHAVLYTYKPYILLISDTQNQAVGFLAAIADELCENEAVIEDFGKLKGSRWREDTLITVSGVKVQALSAGQRLRGLKHKNFRPSLVLLDDVENDENVRTSEQREKLSSWFFKAVCKIGDPKTDIFVVGTVLHKQSLLSSLMENPGFHNRLYKAVSCFSSSPRWDDWKEIYTRRRDPDRMEKAWDYYSAHKHEMLEGTNTLWPERYCYYDLMVERLVGGESAFNSELQNEPGDSESLIFREEDFDYYDPTTTDLQGFDFYGFADPSLGRASGDYSAIVTVARDCKSGVLYVCDAVIARLHPDELIERIFGAERALIRKYGHGYTKFAMETNQFQWYLKDKLAKASAEARLYMPIVEVNSSTEKKTRIMGLQPLIQCKLLIFDRRLKLLLEQLLDYPLAQHDDGPDALAGAVALTRQVIKRVVVNEKNTRL